MTDPARAVEVAREAFLNRPLFTLRLRVLLSVVVPGVVVAAGMTTVTVLLRRTIDQPEGAREATLGLAVTISVLTLVATPLLAILMASLLYRRTVRPIRRFVEDAARIAGGDHTPITPSRPYRDEFTELAVALNRMILEMERRQETGMKAEKLRSIGLLAAGIAHELNNPLQNLLLTAHGLLEEHLTMPENERWELLRDLVRESERARKIVMNLLDFVRQSPDQSAPLVVGDVLEQAVWLARNHLRTRGVTIRLTVEPYLPKVTAGRDQLLQVVLNLLLNAADVTAPDGEVELAAGHDADPDFVGIRVTDRGPGIEEHVLPHIFEPFFTTKPRGKGTGIGLAISQAVIRRYGGSISVTTKAGEGTTFLVRLPAVPLPPDAPAPK